MFTGPDKLISQLGRGFQLSKTNQFVVDGRTYPCGAIKSLSSCFYEKNFKPFGARRRGKHSSSRETGIRLHRNIYHAFTCLKSSKCLCKQRFGTRTNSPKIGSQISNFLLGFKAFLAENSWRVLECEVVAAVKEMNIATSVDVICTDLDPAPKGIYVIEVKTGYDVGRNTPRTLDGTGTMRGACGKDIPNTFASHHQLQLWFGVEAFERTYEIKVDRAVVVYLKKNGKFNADFGAPWWAQSAEKRGRLYSQLLLHTKLY